MKLMRKDAGRERYDTALLEIIKCRPPRPRRATSTKMPNGMHRQTIYLTPNERAALTEFAAGLGIQISEAIRCILRGNIAISIDTADDR